MTVSDVTTLWDPIICDLGTHNPGVKLTAKFKFRDGSKKISSYRPSCGCTDVVMNNNELSANYTTVPLTKSQLEVGLRESQVVKSVFVNYTDGTQDVLKLRVIVTIDKISEKHE